MPKPRFGSVLSSASGVSSPHSAVVGMNCPAGPRSRVKTVILISQTKGQKRGGREEERAERGHQKGTESIWRFVLSQQEGSYPSCSSSGTETPPAAVTPALAGRKPQCRTPVICKRKKTALGAQGWLSPGCQDWCALLRARGPHGSRPGATKSRARSKRSSVCWLQAPPWLGLLNFSFCCSIISV